MTNMEEEAPKSKHQKIKLKEINSYLTCQLCKGYLIDATTISECLHSFCRSCIIKFLQDKSHCPVCEVLINKAKPNLKLDKTLQDIVYKLVPELFINEMCRRQTFYQNHPDQAVQVSPEQRGEDTERTIFNPRDTFSLSIEYISDDSTPGAILLPSNKNLRKNGAQKEPDSTMKRFLQCTGMCRVDVLKKFVRNKYNVDTQKFHIDVLYKRVPLPDHYTLIDIAYIYSWKRNEPMKFFFRITDLKLVKDRFDYMEPVVEFLEPKPVKAVPLEVKEETNTVKASQESESEVAEKLKDEIKNGGGKMNGKNPVYTNITLNRSNNVEIITKIQKVSNKNGQPIGLNIIKQTVKKPGRSFEKMVESDKVNSEKGDDQQVKSENGAVAEESKSDKLKNEKIKVNKNLVAKAPLLFKNGERKAAVQKDVSKILNKGYVSKAVFMPKSESKAQGLVKSDTNKVQGLTKSEVSRNSTKSETSRNLTKSDSSKTDFSKLPKTDSLKSDKSKPSPKSDNVKILPKPQKLQPQQSQQPHQQSSQPPVENMEIEDEKARFLKSIELTARSVLQTIAQTQMESKQPQKRKMSSPRSNPDKPKKPRLEKKIVNKKPKTIKPQAPAENLKTLLNTCKIPSSLSITCVNGDHETQIKPVINHIEILKLPDPQAELDEDKQKLELEKVGTTMQPAPKLEEGKNEIEAKKEAETKNELSITITIENPNDVPKNDKPIGVHPNLPKILPPTGNISRPPNSTFQKMFEEAIKKPEFTNKIQPCSPKNGKAPEGNKRNILEIASQLYKKTKLEHEKMVTTNSEGKVAIPRLNTQKAMIKPKNSVQKIGEAQHQQTLANLHSSSLGLSYSVSVNQKNGDSKTSPKIQSPMSSPKNLASPKVSAHLASPLSSPTLSPISHHPLSLLKLPLQPPMGAQKVQPKVPQMKTTQPPRLSSPRIPSPRPLPAKNSSPRSLTSPKALSSPKMSSPRPLSSPRIPSPRPLSSPRIPSPRPLSSPKLSSPRPQSSPLTIPHTSTPHAHSSSSPQQRVSSPRASSSPKLKDNKGNTGNSASASLDPNQLQEKYNIQNLAQLTASFNFNLREPVNQIALQQAMLLKHLEMQNRQTWHLNVNPMAAQYEKYLQSLNGNGQNHLLGNIKEN